MFGVRQSKASFFDRPAVTSALDRAAKKALSQFGAFVRRRDKSSLKYRKAKSSPGQPPTVHRTQTFTRKSKKGVTSKQASSPLRELTLFAYDAKNRSVVIGAAAFKSRLGSGVVPRVIEEGGTGPYISDGKLKTKVNAPRPHLGPAFKAELPKAPQLLKGRVR